VRCEPTPDAVQRPDRKLGPHDQPGTQLLPAALVHADLPPAATLAVAHEHRSATPVEVVLGESERLLDTQPGAPQHHGDRAQPEAVAVMWAWRITATISSTVGGSAG
jgi:hypothetical protein